jgi:2-methylcitrate dehydratase PrpD
MAAMRETTVTARDLGADLARHAIAARYEDLPGDAVDVAKKSILDLLGVMLAAGGIEPAAKPLLAFVADAGGRPECTVLGMAAKVPAAWAAFANGGLAHCLDFDDLTPWGAHATSSILPAALAIAERRGGVTGRELITAVAIGQDLFARLRRNVDWRKDWNISTVFGVLAATAATGRLLGLTADRLQHALSLATMQAAGTMDVVYGLGGDQRCIYAAFSAKAAVVSAMLAERGVAGTRSAFTGEYGFLNTFFPGAHDVAGMLDGLGTRFAGGSTLFKPWPAVGPSHGHIHATIGIVTENDLRADDIAEIRVSIGDYHEIMCRPAADRQAPVTLVDAKFSLPFLVAVAAVHRDVALSHFAGDGLRDAAVLATARKVVPVRDPAFDWKMDLPGGRVEIATHDGRRLARTASRVPGSPDSPLTWGDIERKFARCAAVAAPPLAADRVAEAQRLARGLDAVDDVAALIRCVG